MSLSDRIRPDVEAAPWVIEEVKELEAKNSRLQEALEWMVANQHLTIMIEEPEHVEHFMSRARTALECK